MFLYDYSRINIIKDSFSFRYMGGSIVRVSIRDAIFNYDDRDNYRETRFEVRPRTRIQFVKVAECRH